MRVERKGLWGRQEEPHGVGRRKGAGGWRGEQGRRSLMVFVVERGPGGGGGRGARQEEPHGFCRRKGGGGGRTLLLVQKAIAEKKYPHSLSAPHLSPTDLNR